MEAKAKIEHVGKSAHRLKGEACDQQRREKAFAAKWAEYNTDDSSSASYLTHLLCTRMATRADRPLLFCGNQVQDRELTQDEATAAATVVQWLGSNVGFSFLEEALRDAGYRIVTDRQRKAEAHG